MKRFSLFLCVIAVLAVDTGCAIILDIEDLSSGNGASSDGGTGGGGQGGSGGSGGAAPVCPSMANVNECDKSSLTVNSGFMNKVVIQIFQWGISPSCILVPRDVAVEFQANGFTIVGAKAGGMSLTPVPSPILEGGQSGVFSIPVKGFCEIPFAEADHFFDQEMFGAIFVDK
jgi:hypothetical protein